MSGRMLCSLCDDHVPQTTIQQGERAAAVKPSEGVWREWYSYLFEILDWPCVNFLSHNIYVDTPRTRQPIGENGSIVLDKEPVSLPEGFDHCRLWIVEQTWR